MIRHLLMTVATTGLLMDVASAAPASGPPSPLSDAVSQAAPRFHDLTITDADPDGSRRWAIWSEGTDGDMTTRLALLSIEGAKASPVWRAAWPHTYSPTLRPTPEWRFGGRPLFAVTFQYGAAAQQLELYALDANQHPVRLAEKLTNLVGWTMSSSGALLLVLYDPSASALLPVCYAWNAEAAALRSTSCPN